MKTLKRLLGQILDADERPEGSLAFDPLSLAALICLGALVFGMLASSGNLTDGPRLVDDNQVFRLQAELRAGGLAQTLRSEFESRLHSYGRFLPVYAAQKVIVAWLLGGNMVAWSLYVGSLGVLTAYCLFLFGRQLRFTVAESLLFALLVTYGPQSVVWWRLLHGEGPGMLLLSAALICMALGVYSPRGRTVYTALFVVFAVMASLCKESFILLLPALGLWRLRLFHQSATQMARDEGTTAPGQLRASLRSNTPWLAVLAAVCLGELLTIKYVVGRTTFVYAGWDGFDAGVFLTAAGQFVRAANPWMAATVLVLGALPVVVLGTRRAASAVAREIVSASLLLVLIVVPQLLLYQKSGFVSSGTPQAHIHFERYLLPALLAPAIFTVSLLSVSRRQWRAWAEASEGSSWSWVGKQWLVQPLIVVGLLASVSGRTALVHGRAETYSARNGEVNDWFESIVRNTAVDDPIVIVYGPDVGIRDPLRVKFILEERYQRRNLFFYHLPYLPMSYSDHIERFENLVAEGRRRGGDLVPHAGLMRGADSLDDWRGVKVVAILRSTSPLEAEFAHRPGEDALRKLSQDWLQEGRYHRYANTLGDVTLYRSGRP